MADPALHDAMEDHDRVYLEKLRLAASVILELAENCNIPCALETELYIFRDRIDRICRSPPPNPSAPAPAPVPQR